MEKSELRALVKEMRELGIIQLKTSDIDLVLGPEPRKVSKTVEAMRASFSVPIARDEDTNGRDLTDEEILFASSAGWPDEAEHE